MGRIGGIEKLEKFDEFAAAMAVLDEGVNLAVQQINPGQQTDGAVALVFMIARETAAKTHCVSMGLLARVCKCKCPQNGAFHQTARQNGGMAPANISKRQPQDSWLWRFAACGRHRRQQLGGTL